MRKLPVLLLAVLALAACSPQPRQAPSAGATTVATRHPISGLDVIPLTIAHDGQVRRFAVEVARTDAEQARGLMFRKAMGADEGMLFVRRPPDLAVFWMKNTVLPLDIVFIGRDRRIINIIANAVPYSETPLPSLGVAAAVLELNGGRAAELGIGEGDQVDW